MVKQSFESKYTSINSVKLPAIYNKIDWDKLRKEHENNYFMVPMIFDYGCGRYTAHIREFLYSKGFDYIGYDPYWSIEQYPIESFKQLYPTAIVCSNVLNVIKENDIIYDIKHQLYSFRVPCFFTVYEGDGSWIGCESKKGCWQRNETKDAYLTRCDEIFRKNVLTLSQYKTYIV